MSPQQGNNVCKSYSHQLIPKLINNDLRFELSGNSNLITGLSLLVDNETIKFVQKRSKDLSKLFKLISQDIPCRDWPNSHSNYRRYRERLHIIDGVLVFADTKVIVVPFVLVVELAICLHFNFAHIGRDKLMHLMSELVWHPSQSKIISDVCTTCYTCQLFKDYSTPIVPPTLKISTSYPFELMAADTMLLPRSSAGYVACLVVVDHYSKFVMAVPLKNKQSQTIVNAFSRQILPSLPCVPTNILTDGGPEFVANVFDELLAGYGIVHKRTTPYSPTSNGCCERVNKSIQNLMKTLLDQNNNWDEHLSRVVIAQNNTLHKELGMSPAKFLMTKSHAVSTDPTLQGHLRERWKVGHQNFCLIKWEISCG